MILDEIVLHNFGVYGGRHSVVLTPEPGRPVILVGALNGSGKTTFLDAIQLALYGRRARLSNRGDLAYEEYLRRSVHRGVRPSEGASLTLSFRHWELGVERRYRVLRLWRDQGRGLKEVVEVWRDDVPDHDLSGSWTEHFEAILPQGVSHLFFFDGEKIEALADPEQAREVLASAVFALLGVDLVDQLLLDLTSLERRKKQALVRYTDRKGLDESESELEELRRHLGHAAQERASAQNEVDRARRALDKAEEALRQAGGEAFERRGQLEADKTRLEAQVDEARSSLRSSAEGALPLVLVAGLFERTLSQVRRQQQAERTRALLAELDTRDRSTLSFAGRLGLSRDNLAALENHLNADREQRGVGQGLSHYLSLSERAFQEAQALLSSGLDEEVHRVASKVDELEEYGSRLVECERRLSFVPDAESVASKIVARERARSDLRSAEIELARHQEAEETARRLTEVQHHAHLRRIEEAVKVELENRATGRLIAHAEKSRRTLETFRAELLARQVRRIAGYVLESFQELTHKRDLVSRIEIDPKDFTLTLTAANGEPLTSERLSAGERQLLAVAMLWGLARVAARPLPAVIDTPLGRLDSAHRTALTERYFPRASHQVIILSTDEEISGRYYDQLGPYVGRAYTLRFDDETGSTTVSTGYAWSTEVEDVH